MAATTLDHTVELRELILTGEARRLRVTAKISLSHLADDVGVTIGAVSHWEQCRRFPTGDLAGRYLKALHKIRKLAIAMEGVA